MDDSQMTDPRALEPTEKPVGFPEPGATVTLKSNSKRYRGGLAEVIRHELRRGHPHPRWWLVVNFQGNEILVMPGECHK